MADRREPARKRGIQDAGKSPVMAHSENRGTGQSVSIIITDKTIIWFALLVVGVLASIGLIEAKVAYDMAQRADMTYTLVYSHQIKQEAYLAEHGILIDSFGTMPKPKEKDK